MGAPAERFITEEEYTRLEEAASEKHEYFNGHIWAMAGASPTHNIVASNVLVAVGSRLRGKPCRAVASDQRVKVEATGLRTYPDVLVVCPPERYDERDPNSLLNPRVIIEVLSPSTEGFDRAGKFEHYTQIESLSDYILVAQDRVRVEHFARGEGGWMLRSYTMASQVLALRSIEAELPLEEIYDRLQLPEGLAMLTQERDRV